jgi:LemA protein
MQWLILAVVAGVLVVWGVWIFNRCIGQRNKVREAWSGIDVQLKRRHDLVPSLVETVKGYKVHEAGTLEEIVKARNLAVQANGASAASPAESNLSSRIKTLFALAEAYPDLKADENFRQLSGQLVEIEDQIQYARRYYNGAVRDMNNLIQTFPNNILTGLLHFAEESYFEITSETERQTPQVNL